VSGPARASRQAPPSAGGEADPCPASLLDFQRRRKEGSRERLLAAATAALCDRGYFAVSVEEIASAAGVSRMTFYRHFSGKAAIAAELFRQSAEAAMPRFLAIRERDFRDPVVVAAWIADLFAGDRTRPRLLRVFTQANVDEAGFTEQAQSLIDDLIAGLSAAIPAFAIDQATASGRRRWIEAWLLLYDILDQSNHAARGSGPATDPLMVEVLAERFTAFVGAAPSC
jgi:AcrR family transcriptional regulator